MIYIIIPVHNRKNFTKQCLLSLRSQTYKNFKIVIVDDGSTDGTKSMLKEEFPEVHIITGNGNLWWTGAINLGIKYALKNSADYILTLNNDTIPEKNFLEKMIKWEKKCPNCILGAFAIDKNSLEPIWAGVKKKWKNDIFFKNIKLLEKYKNIKLIKSSYLPGRGLFFPAKIIKRIGYFDEKHFPHYGSDDDFTLRAEKYNFKNYCNLEAKLYIYPTMSWDDYNRKNISIKNYFQHLFTKKGGGNLKNFITIAIRYCPRKYLIQYLLIGIIKRIFGYWVHTIAKNRIKV